MASLNINFSETGCDYVIGEKNCRPISLINVGTKFGCKALAKRLELILRDLTIIIRVRMSRVDRFLILSGRSMMSWNTVDDRIWQVL